jgi:hypothetical protein
MQFWSGRRPSEGAWAVFSVFTVLLGGAFLANPAIPLAAGACLAFIGYFMRQGGRRHRNGQPRVAAAAIIYAVTLALFLVFVRSASSFIQPQEPLIPSLSGIPAAYYAEDMALSVYGKAHIRKAAIQLFFFACLFAVFLAPVCRPLASGWRKLAFSPYAAGTIFIAFVSTAPVPPLAWDLDRDVQVSCSRPISPESSRRFSWRRCPRTRACD